MYKVITIVIFLVLLINPVLMSKNVEFSSQVNQLLSNLFTSLKLEEVNAYISEVDNNKLYLNVGQDSKLVAGQELLVVRPIELIQDPITKMNLARINKKLAVIVIKKVEKNYSVAKIKEELVKDKIKVRDKVINNESKIKIALDKFEASKASTELAEELEGRFYSYLTRHKLFQVNSVELTEKKQLLNLETDYLLTGEIYNNSDKIFLKVKLYNVNSGLVIKDKIISFNNKDEVINYYKTKYKDKHLGYKLLFVTKQFTGSAFNFQWRDFKNGGLLINTEFDLKMMDYDNNNNELTTKYIIDNYQRTKYDDYNLVFANIDEDQNPEIFVENYNYPIKFKKINSQYQAQVLKKFNRNRPKAIATLNNKKYLILRDYKSLLKFNLWEENEFITDFEIKVKSNEGYRLDLADVDKDQELELIITSYQGDNRYKIKIYSLDYELEATLGPIVGPEFVIANINNNQSPEIYSYSKDSNQVLSFEWQGDKYKKNWQSESLSEDIIDLTVGDINQDDKKELLVLVKNNDKNKIYTYQFKTLN